MNQPSSPHRDLLEQFEAYLSQDESTLFFLTCTSVADLVSPPYGNVSTLAAVSGFLSLCGLPLPTEFDRWSFNSTAFAPFLRANHRFYLDAQHAYVRLLISAIDCAFQNVELARRLCPADELPNATVKPSILSTGFAMISRQTLMADDSSIPPRINLLWQGIPIGSVSNLDEWFRLTQKIDAPIQPGLQMHRIRPLDSEQPEFWARSTNLIESGPLAGRLQCNDCFRPAAEPSLAFWDLTPDHPLSQWLAGYHLIPDQTPRQQDVIVTADPSVGDWASLSFHHPWRQLIAQNLRTIIRTQFK